jgi:hypothetical protein
MSDSAVSASVSFGEVWTAVTDVAHTLSTEASMNLVDNGFVIPRGINAPSELTDWVGEPSQMEVHLTWPSWASENLGTSLTGLRFGAVWYFGGRVEGRGRYIGNADVFCVVTGLGLGHRFEISASFDNPITVGNNVAQLSGSITIERYYWRMLEDTTRYQIELKGDGAGRMWQI